MHLAFRHRERSRSSPTPLRSHPWPSRVAETTANLDEDVNLFISMQGMSHESFTVRRQHTVSVAGAARTGTQREESVEHPTRLLDRMVVLEAANA